MGTNTNTNTGPTTGIPVPRTPADLALVPVPAEHLDTIPIPAGIDMSRRSRLAVYVPSTEDTDQPIPQQEFTDRTDRISRFLSRLFGGVTVIPSAGYWIDPGDRLIYERINIVQSAMGPADLAEHLDTVFGAMTRYRDIWRQTAVTLDVNGIMIMI